MAKSSISPGWSFARALVNVFPYHYFKPETLLLPPPLFYINAYLLFSGLLAEEQVVLRKAN